jgi:hypothetical protein
MHLSFSARVAAAAVAARVHSQAQAAQQQQMVSKIER